MRLRDPAPLTPAQWDKEQAVEADRVRDDPQWYQGRQWLVECRVAIAGAETDEDREKWRREFDESLVIFGGQDGQWQRRRDKKTFPQRDEVSTVSGVR